MQSLRRDTAEVFTGNDIQRLREALNMSPVQFASLLGIHLATLYRWEAKGDAQVRLDPMQLGVLLALQEQLNRQRTAKQQEEWAAALLGALVIGGGLFALYKILEAAFDSPQSPGGARARR